MSTTVMSREQSYMACVRELVFAGYVRIMGDRWTNWRMLRTAVIVDDGRGRGYHVEYE